MATVELKRQKNSTDNRTQKIFEIIFKISLYATVELQVFGVPWNSKWVRSFVGVSNDSTTPKTNISKLFKYFKSPPFTGL
jgi:hypothetical protein